VRVDLALDALGNRLAQPFGGSGRIFLVRLFGLWSRAGGNGRRRRFVVAS
jgi:hypothetical protein